MISRPALIVLLVSVSIAAYHLPWVTHDVAAFSNNAFDLAEYMSLHPSVQAESPALYTSLLLRLPIILTAMMVALTAALLESEKARWIWRGIALVIILRLNPPTIYYPVGGGSLNDQQLGNLMLVGLVAVSAVIGATLLPIKKKLLFVATGLLALVNIGVAVVGYTRSIDRLALIALQVDIGGGYLSFVASMMVVVGYTLWELLPRRKREQSGQGNPYPTPSTTALSGN